MIDKDQLMKFHLESVELGYPTKELQHEIAHIVNRVEKLYKHSPSRLIHIMESKCWSYLNFKKYERGDIFDFYVEMTKFGIERSIKYHGRFLKLKTFLDIM